MKTRWQGVGPGRQYDRGFTLIEIMTATVIFSLMMAIVFAVLGQASDVWRKSSGKVEVFQGARLAYELITRNLGQATLNTYLDYDSRDSPQRYLRQSELQFVCVAPGINGVPGVTGTGTAVFFQAPAVYTEDNSQYGGLDNALNVCGYYIEYGPDTTRPSHIGSQQRYRYRLMQLMVPIEHNMIFTHTGETEFQWFTDYSNAGVPGSYYARPVADNVIALIVRPQDPNDSNLFSSTYNYNSRLNATQDPQPVEANQLPPVMQVTMVAIDELSAGRMGNTTAQPALISGALNSKFQNPSQYENDLEALGGELAVAGISYRVFSSAVPMRESKWSKN